MMYSELLKLTDGKATYEQFLDIEAVYMSREKITKKQAASLWRRRYAEKTRKPLAKELREIKVAIRDFKENREYAERQEAQIKERYAEKLAEYDPNDWKFQRVIESLSKQRDEEICQMWDSYGNDAAIHIIYEDGSECIATGLEIVSGEVVPRMQHIAYATYSDGWIEYDTLTGILVDNDTDFFGDLSTDEGIEAREQYFNNIEIMFGTEWGKRHNTTGGENERSSD